MAKLGAKRPPIRKSEEDSKREYSYSYKYYGYNGYGRDRRPRKLNLWLLAATVAVLGIGGPALYYWHNHQITRLSASLLEHADTMAAEEKWREASDAYYRVWEIRKDPSLLGKLADSYDKYAVQGDRAGVIAYYQRAVGALPQQLELRTRLAELLLKDGRAQFALEQADKVLLEEPNNQLAIKWRALSLLSLHRVGQSLDVDVLEELTSAYRAQPKDFDLAFGLIGHLRRDLKAQNGTKLGRQADKVINNLVKALPDDATAYLARHQYRLKYGLPGAKQDIAQAMLLAPDNPVIIQKGAWDALRDALAKTNRANGDYLTTRQLFKKLIELQPKDASGYLGLGDVEYLVKSDIDQAIDIWSEGREKAGDSLPLLLRIAEGQVNLYRYDEAEETLNTVQTFLSSLSSKGSEDDRNWATASSALFRGKIKLARKQPYDAIPDLELAASLGREQVSETRAGKSTAFSALLALGKTYTKLGQVKNAAASYDRALMIQPESETALLSAADAWASLGDLDRAITFAERALRLRSSSGEANRYLAQYLLEKQIAKPQAERNWTDFEEAFKAARWQLADSWKLRFIDVDYTIRRQDQNDVSSVLGKLLAIETDFPKDVQVWRRLPFIYESIGTPEETDRALNRLEEITSSSPETKFVLVDILLARKKVDEAQVVLDGVAEDSLTPQEAWLRDLAQLRVIEANANQSKIDEQLKRLIIKYPLNITLIERFLDRRLCGASTSTAPTTKELLSTLKKRQANAEPNWQYYEARLQLADENPDMNLVRTHLATLRNRLPYWSRTQELVGRVALRDENEREAKLAFEDAVLKPRPNPAMIHTLIADHLDGADLLAAMDLVELQKEKAPLARLLTGTWSDLQEKLDFDLVSQGVTHRSASHEFLWRQIYEEVDPSNFADEHPDSLLGQILSLRGQETDLLSLENRHFDGADERAFVLGQAYEYLGDYRKARELFGQVEESSPYRYQAELYLGLAKNRQKAARIEAANSSMLALESRQRLEAIFLLRRAGKRDLRKAKGVLEDLVETSASDLNDRRLLALCLEKLNETSDAKEQFLAVVDEAPTAQNLAAFIDFLLRNGHSDEAQVWLEQLEDQSGWSRTSIALRTRWLAATDRQREIKPLVELFAQRQFQQVPDDIPAEMRSIAGIYRDVNMLGDAKRWLSILARRFPDQAEPLSFLLIENDETERAIQRCTERLSQSPDANTAALLARVLVYGNVSRETMNQVQPLLDESLRNFPDDAALLFAVGNLRLKQDDTRGAIDFMRKVTELRPGHYLAWNNLAALLAEQSGRQGEAMETIDKAISYAAYDIPTLYDTKAVVFIHRQEYQQAVDLLRENVTGSRSVADPRFYFHLAMSLARLGNDDEAKEALASADDLDLDSTYLTTFERNELKYLRDKFANH